MGTHWELKDNMWEHIGKNPPKNEVIVELFESPKSEENIDLCFFVSACNQKYRRMIIDLYIVSGLQARFWLNLPKDGHHVFYIFL
jgi:hypothetical protein